MEVTGGGGGGAWAATGDTSVKLSVAVPAGKLTGYIELFSSLFLIGFSQGCVFVFRLCS